MLSSAWQVGVKRLDKVVFQKACTEVCRVFNSLQRLSAPMKCNEMCVSLFLVLVVFIGIHQYSAVFIVFLQ